MAKIRKIKEKELIGGTSNIEVYPITHTKAVYDSKNRTLESNLEYLNSEIVWGGNSNIDTYTTAGVYNITGERRDLNDGLPILNSNPGHTINARLEVFDSSIPDTTNNDDKCITQKLTLSNRVAGDGDVYIRTGRGKDYSSITWEPWGKLQQNIEVGSVTNLDNLIDNGIYSGVYKYGSGQYDYETFVLVVINDYAVAGGNRKISQFKYALSLTGEVSYKSRLYSIKAGEDFARWDSNWLDINEANINKTIQDAIAKVVGTAPDTLDTLQEIAAWVESHEDLYAMLKALAEDNTLNINKETERAQNAEKEIKNNAMQYNTLGVSVYADKAEIYGRSINTDVRVVEFPAATTEKAGVMSAEDKKIVDGLENGSTIVGQAREIHSRNGKTVTDSFLARTTAGSGTIGDGVATLKSVGGNIVKNLVDGAFSNDWKTHSGVTISKNDGIAKIISQWGGMSAYCNVNNISGHKYYICLNVKSDKSLKVVTSMSSTITANNWRKFSAIHNAFERIYITTDSDNQTIYLKNILIIDLTEMFGETKANQMTKEECDKLFGTMDTLPQGLTVANPKEFKSIGYNQADPNKVLVDKGIDNGAIVDKGGSNLAVVPCLPCNIGVGENNGYCIHGSFDEGAEKVYLTPLNPLEVEGELYMHELTKDADKGTYVPQIKGYMLVEVPNATDLCVHFLWSEDRGRHDFEPYYESKVELPKIPEMSEYGFAGVLSKDTLVCDEIDLEKGVYRKKIGAVDMGSVSWYYSTNAQRFDITISGRKYADKNVLLEGYTTIPLSGSENYKSFKVVFGNTANDHIFIYDTAYTDAASFKAAMRGVILYYELAEPIEYPLPKVANNYTSSDYGVEQFDGAVPCNANNLYYMRSLAGETRNFLDKMYANTGKESSKDVADYITDGIADNKAKAEEAPNLALRALFVAAGAEYNDTDNNIVKTAPWGDKVEHLPGHYYLNGLGDITEEQMMEIYNAPHGALYAEAYSGLNIRTSIYKRTIGYGSIMASGAFSASKIEVFGARVENLFVSDATSMFSQCAKLKYCIPIIKSKKTSGAFSQCPSLIMAKIHDLAVATSFAHSTQISKDSILFSIQNAAPTSAITITLHADAYARLKDDADIVAALTAQPLVTLVSA